MPFGIKWHLIHTLPRLLKKDYQKSTSWLDYITIEQNHWDFHTNIIVSFQFVSCAQFYWLIASSSTLIIPVGWSLQRYICELKMFQCGGIFICYTANPNMFEVSYHMLHEAIKFRMHFLSSPSTATFFYVPVYFYKTPTYCYI